MDKLILELSKDLDDESQQSRTIKLFGEQMAKPNGAPKRFTNLFDAVQVIVGGRAQTEARRRAELMNCNYAVVLVVKCSIFSWIYKLTTSYNRALVDMMIQMKTLVKKAEGSLKDEGDFHQGKPVESYR